MKNNLRIVNMIVSGKIPLKKRMTTKNQSDMIMRCDWFSPREDMIMISKQFNYRKKKILNVHKKQKNPYVTIWCSGAIVIVGLKNRKEAHDISDLVIKNLKYCGVKLI